MLDKMKPLLLEAGVRPEDINTDNIKDADNSGANIYKLYSTYYLPALETKGRCPEEMWTNYKLIFPNEVFEEQEELNQVLKELKNAFYEIFKKTKSPRKRKEKATPESEV